MRFFDDHPYTERDILRFKTKLVEHEGCLLYTGSVNHRGYGLFHLGTSSTKRYVAAHRFWYAVNNDDYDRTMMCLHTCHTPNCVRHIYQGTHAQNMIDRDDSKRTAKGERGGTAKLTSEQVIAMRNDRANGAKVMELAEKYNISKSNVSYIVRGIHWRHIGGPRTRSYA